MLLVIAQILHTLKLYVNCDPGCIEHCVTEAGPSIDVDPFMKRPWKWRVVLWLPSWLSTFTMTVSPFVAVIIGRGHCPFIPIVGRSCLPSGFALTQVMLKSYVTVAASVRQDNASSKAPMKGKYDNEIAIVVLVDYLQRYPRIMMMECDVMSWTFPR